MVPGTPPTNPEEQTIHLGDYYHLLLRHKWTIVLSVLIVFSLVMLHNSRLIPVYQAMATMIIDSDITKSPVTGQRMDYESYMSESLTFNTHFKLITSRPVMERVIQKLDLDPTDLYPKRDKPSFAPVSAIRQWIYQLKRNMRLLLGMDRQKQAGEGGSIGFVEPLDETTRLVRALQGMVQVQPIEETRLLMLQVYSPIPHMAREIANASAQAYIDFNIANRLESSQNTLAWLTDNLYDIKKQLEDAEQEFLAYKQDAQLISLEDSQEVTAQKMREFNDAYIQTRNKRLELDAKLSQLRRVAETGKNIPHVRSLIENPLITELYGRMVQAEVELESLSKVYKPKHPKIVQITTDIQNIREKLRQELQKEVENLRSERAVLVSRERVLQNTMEDFEQEALATNKKELRYNILERNVEMNKNLYDTLLARLKEADLSGSIDVSNIRITEKATMPQFPVSPNKKRNLMLGLVFGLMLGVGLSFLKEYIDRTIHTEDDVQRYLNLPVLSVIPKADQARGKGYYGSHGTRVKKETSDP
jgi:uncharacterized protein involved in exopolysaccharide biosynthesis